MTHLSHYLATVALTFTAFAQTAAIRSLEVKILSTMLADQGGIGEWGFAAVVEIDGRRILFDTGARPRTVLENARELKVDLASITDVILSHNHSDHTGGLVTLRRELARQNPKALSQAYAATGMFYSREGRDGSEANPMIATRRDYEAAGGAIIESSKPVQIAPGAWLTGPVPRPNAERNWSGTGLLRRPGGARTEDNLPEDQSLVLDTARGLVLISGCGHAGIVNTIEHTRATVREAPLYAAIGGFHLFNATDEHMAWTAEKLKSFGLRNFWGAHCTGIETVYRMRQLTGLGRRESVVGAVGATFRLDRGIEPGAIAR